MNKKKRKASLSLASESKKTKRLTESDAIII